VPLRRRTPSESTTSWSASARDPASVNRRAPTRAASFLRVGWIASEFQAISDANGERLRVSIDTFDVPKGGRIPADQTMSNVVAILPGADPSDNRIFVVSGHYDSVPADSAQDAPGANDDASGNRSRDRVRSRFGEVSVPRDD
jgi:hypothetical protein